MSTHSDPDVLSLRRLLRDLVALSGVAVAWVGREPSAIAADFADLLVDSLDVDSAFVRLCDPKDRAAVETARGKPWPALLEWLRARLRPQPIASFSQPAEALPTAEQIPSTYILCTQFGFQDTAARCRAKGWPVLKIDCGHDAMVIKPRELVDLLLTPDCH